MYVFPYVAPGSYRLTTEFEGFKTSTQTGITLETGITRSVNVMMEIGELTEVVTVEALDAVARVGDVGGRPIY